MNVSDSQRTVGDERVSIQIGIIDVHREIIELTGDRCRIVVFRSIPLKYRRQGFVASVDWTMQKVIVTSFAIDCSRRRERMLCSLYSIEAWRKRILTVCSNNSYLDWERKEYGRLIARSTSINDIIYQTQVWNRWRFEKYIYPRASSLIDVELINEQWNTLHFWWQTKNVVAFFKRCCRVRASWREMPRKETTEAERRARTRL